MKKEKTEILVGRWKLHIEKSYGDDIEPKRRGSVEGESRPEGGHIDASQDRESTVASTALCEGEGGELGG